MRLEGAVVGPHEHGYHVPAKDLEEVVVADVPVAETVQCATRGDVVRLHDADDVRAPLTEAVSLRRDHHRGEETFSAVFGEDVTVEEQRCAGSHDDAVVPRLLGSRGQGPYEASQIAIRVTNDEERLQSRVFEPRPQPVASYRGSERFPALLGHRAVESGTVYDERVTLHFIHPDGRSAHRIDGENQPTLQERAGPPGSQPAARRHRNLERRPGGDR